MQTGLVVFPPRALRSNEKVQIVPVAAIPGDLEDRRVGDLAFDAESGDEAVPSHPFIVPVSLSGEECDPVTRLNRVAHVGSAYTPCHRPVMIVCSKQSRACDMG